MANLDILRTTFRDARNPIIQQRTAARTAQRDQLLSGYNEAQQSTQKRYSDELARLTQEAADKEKSEVGRATAQAAAAGASGGVDTANRLMIQQALGKLYGSQRQGTISAQEEALSRIANLISAEKAASARELADISAEELSIADQLALKAYETEMEDEAARRREEIERAKIGGRAYDNQVLAALMGSILGGNTQSPKASERVALDDLYNIPTPSMGINYGKSFAVPTTGLAAPNTYTPPAAPKRNLSQTTGTGGLYGRIKSLFGR